MADLMEQLVSLAKRRGIVFQSSEIYGGLRSSWDYGPLGAELRRNIRDAWWRSMVHLRDDVVGLEASIIMSPRVWEASGHVAGFSRPVGRVPVVPSAVPAGPSPGQGRGALLPQLRSTRVHRAAPVQPDVHDPPGTGRGRGSPRLPPAGDGAGDVRRLQDRAAVGPPEDPLRDRPDRAVRSATRSRPGTSSSACASSSRWRWSSSSSPGPTTEWFEYWVAERLGWFTGLGVRPEKLRLRAARPRRAGPLRQGGHRHRVRVPVRVGRAGGDREPARLRPAQHQEHSAARTSPTSTRRRDRRYLPFVIEPARRGGPGDAGVPARRAPRGGGAHRRRAGPRSAPSSGCTGTWLRSRWPCCRCRGTRRWSPRPGGCGTWSEAAVDDRVTTTPDRSVAGTGARTRRARRYCVTVDFDSLEDRQVTVRDRDTMPQDRIPIEGLVTYLQERLP